MLKRSLAFVMAMGLGLFLVACEVQNDTDSTEGDVTVGDGVTGDTTDQCPGTTEWACDEQCAEDGVFDPDCIAPNCNAAEAVALIVAWKASGKANLLPANDDTCAYYNADGSSPYGADDAVHKVAVCEAQFKCSNIACFCDPDCAGGIEPCGADGHCDSWCLKDTDPDCAGDEKNGKGCADLGL